MAAEQRKVYEDFFDKTDAMGLKDGSVSIMELKKMVVEGLGQKKTDREIAVSGFKLLLGGSKGNVHVRELTQKKITVKYKGNI